MECTYSSPLRALLDGVNDNGPHRLKGLNTCSLVCGTFWKEEENVWLCLMSCVNAEEILGFKRPVTFPLSSLASACD